MTIEEAQAEAERRWGSSAQVVESWQQGSAHFTVGLRMSGESKFFPAIAGEGDSWEAAFLEADERMHPVYIKGITAAPMHPLHITSVTAAPAAERAAERKTWPHPIAAAVPSDLVAEKDAAYQERDRLVCALSKLFPASLERHPDEDKAWEDDWRWIVFVQLPTGQATWHIHDSELSWFDHLPRHTGQIWDGHTTAEKYQRLAALWARRVSEHDYRVTVSAAYLRDLFRRSTPSPEVPDATA